MSASIPSPYLNMPYGALISTVLLATAILVTLGILSVLRSSPVTDPHGPREPLEAKAAIPYIGHLVGLMRSTWNYSIQLRQVPLPIFSLSIPGWKIYVVTAPDYIQMVQKQAKKLAFPPIQANFAKRICGVSEEAHNIMMKNVNGDEGDWGFSMESYETMRSALKPGADLDKMNRQMIIQVAISLDALATEIHGSTQLIGIYEWLRNCITIATTYSVYGPLNPFKEKAVADAYWQFENDLMKILVGFMPSILARKGLAGRAQVSDAFEKYFSAGGHKEASVLMQNRYNVSARHGVSIEDIAKYEVGGATAILVNTAPTAFWMLILVFAHPGLVQRIRKEVEAVMIEKLDELETHRTIDITSLKATCPLLTSTFQEVLRYRSMGIAVRKVMSDTVLNDRFLLKKGNMIQMPSRIIHSDSSIWGPDVDEFNPERFMKAKKTTATNSKNPPAHAFRAFGGGSTLCPGRHFATNEILAVITMFIMRFDMLPAKGTWTLPTTWNTDAAAVIMEPDYDVEVIIFERKGFENGKWAFGLQDSEEVFAIVAEDR